MIIPLVVVLALLGLVTVVDAAPCTKGVNCYCDKVQGGSLNDPQLLLCEDFEAPTLINDQGVGQGPPYYGPWYDQSGSGFSCGRGFNSYWNKVYGNGAGSDLWAPGTPASPTRGCTCSAGGSFCFNAGWDPANRWQAPATVGIGMFQDSDYSAEVPTIAKPTGRAGGGAGSFDGKVSLAQRVKAGFPNTQDIHGGKGWASVRTLGVTMAVAFPNNLFASGILAGPAWKFNEWGQNGPGDGLLMFHLRDYGLASQFPFKQLIMFSPGGETTAGCNSKLNAATKTLGDFQCTDVTLYFFASPTVYNQAVDWPLGTWGCVRGYYQNMGLANSAIQIWFTGPSGVEKKILDLSNMDTSRMFPGANGGYGGYAFDSYANGNNNDGSGGPPTIQTTFRYEDNIHIRAGTPVSCAQIGFGGSGTVSTPTAPGGVSLQ